MSAARRQFTLMIGAIGPMAMAASGPPQTFDDTVSVTLADVPGFIFLKINRSFDDTEPERRRGG